MKVLLTTTAILIGMIGFNLTAHAEESTVAAIQPRTTEQREFSTDIARRSGHLPASWKWSVAAVVASQALDVSSSYGMRELNPVLAGSDGRFGMKATTIKLSATGALLAVEYLIVKAHPGAARVFSKLNWSGAAVTGGVAAYNFTLK